MSFTKLTRREFIKGTVSAVAVTSFPQIAFGQSAGTRLEWSEFIQTTQYPSYLDAIAQMRANTDPNARESWQYWVNIHRTNCPHGVAYFLAWHRGFVLYLQQTLRVLSGNTALTVPYWDYYSNPNIPPEFTDPSPDNPLYVANRVNTNVRSALSLLPFSSTFVNFPRGMTNAFEPQIEYRPHGTFHNLVGGAMATLDSPLDPIFWLHHGQIDRLWAGWVAANAGRQMPPVTDPYWAGSHVYRADLTMRRDLTYSPANLRYAYNNVALPTSLPPAASARARLIRVQTQGAASPGNSAARPPVGKFPISGPKEIGKNRRSIGGAREITLNENSVTAIIPVSPPDVDSLEAIADGQKSSPFGRGKDKVQYTSLKIVLDNVSLAPAGQAGGYYYEIYLNLPERGNPRDDAHFIGSFGPFEINTAHHHPGSSYLVFHASRVLPLTSNGLGSLSISFVRISGPRAPQGPVITVGEMRAVLSTDPVE
jgi:tyrosinase